MFEETITHFCHDVMERIDQCSVLFVSIVLCFASRKEFKNIEFTAYAVKLSAETSCADIDCQSYINGGSQHVWNGNKYMYVREWTTWYDAEKICIHWGGHLASIKNREENGMIESMLYYLLFYIGISWIRKNMSLFSAHI